MGTYGKFYHSISRALNGNIMQMVNITALMKTALSAIYNRNLCIFFRTCIFL